MSAKHPDNTLYVRERAQRDPVFNMKRRDTARVHAGHPPRQMYLPVTMDDYEAVLETMIERVPANAQTAKWYEGWKQLRRDGWTVTVLVSPDRSSLVGLACRWGERWRFQP
jgi:hypothetical protein